MKYTLKDRKLIRRKLNLLIQVTETLYCVVSDERNKLLAKGPSAKEGVARWQARMDKRLKDLGRYRRALAVLDDLDLEDLK